VKPPARCILPVKSVTGALKTNSIYYVDHSGMPPRIWRTGKSTFAAYMLATDWGIEYEGPDPPVFQRRNSAGPTGSGSGARDLGKRPC